MKTTAAVLTRINAPLEILELTVPRLSRGQVLVRVLAAGLCRSQLNEVHGLKGKDPYIPHLLGHEASGIVEDIGAGVSTVKKGDYVVLSWLKGKGMDVPGGIFKYKRRKVNAGAVTVFTEYAVVSENRVTKISKQIPQDIAALFGCAVATGAGVVRHTLNVRPGSGIAIFGIGGIGASAIMAARASRAKDIIAIDITPRKLTWARQLGATVTVNAAKTDARTAIYKKFPNGVEYAVEAAGLPRVIEQAFQVLSNHGILAITGHPKQGSRINLDPFAFIQGKCVVGTWGGRTIPDKDFPYYAGQFLRGKLPLGKLITHTFPLTEINEALTLLESGEAGRIIIRIGED